ncbi:uncharacterized protein LOC128957977 [Oppia nitens]|uniref:uncharacterized protein LOC128957977 n=1 Tax=Oppia nitens TaxID=1686743 RepID=UPI0023DAD1CF|nr:uncharacterized protein LOC128957977 [Oppia nitens]
MRIDHDYKGLLDNIKKYSKESDNYNNGYKARDDHKNSGYGSPSGYGHQRRHDDYDSDSYQTYRKADYGSYSTPNYQMKYETPKYESKYEDIKYDSKPSYGQQGYGLTLGQSYPQTSYEPTYEKTYSSPVSAYRHVEIKPIQTQGYGGKDHVIDVKDDQPIVIHFRTHANRVKVEQTRIPDHPPQVEHQKSEDEPHRVVHEVYKPVIQEVREIIQPFRKVIQQVQPVVEEVQTVVHKGTGRRGSGGGEYDQKQVVDSYGKSANKKYSSIKDYLPQGSIVSHKSIPAYRPITKGSTVPHKTQ